MTEDTLHIHLDVVEMQIVACVLVCSEVHHPVGCQPPPPPRCCRDGCSPHRQGSVVMAHNTTSIRVIAAGTRVCSSIVCSVSHGVPAPQHMLSNPYITQAAAVLENPNPAIWSVPLGEPWPRMHSKTALAAVAVAEPGLGVWGDIQSITGGAIRTLTPFFSYYGIHSLMFGGYPPTAIGYPPTAIGCTPTAISYPPTAIGYPPTAIGCTPTAISYPPTAIGYPPAAIVGRIGHSEFFFFHYGTP